MSSAPEGSHEHKDDEAFIIVKAAPRASQSHGETVCIAAIDMNGKWVRLYPVSFRHLADGQKFGRWDRISYRWRKATSDQRVESRRVDQDSIEIKGKLKEGERHSFLSRAAVSSLKAEWDQGRSLAILNCEIIDFWHEPQTAEELKRQEDVYDNMRRQNDFFSKGNLIPREACPHVFKYRYRDADGIHIGTCQDWETEATFLHRRRDLGSEAAALDWMVEKFGVEFPQKGMVLAMGTHRRWEGQWLINGVLRANPVTQMTML